MGIRYARRQTKTWAVDFLFEVISLCILLLLSKLGVVDAISSKQVQSLQDMTYQEVYLEGDEICWAILVQ